MKAVGVAALLLSSLVSSEAQNVKQDIKKMFEDTKAYHNFMMPLLYANYLTYKTYPGPHRDGFYDEKQATIPAMYSGGSNWQRLSVVDREDGPGAHARAFVDYTNKKAIVAFRGACSDELLPSCLADMKLLRRATQGTRTPSGGRLKDYVDGAVKHVEAVRNQLGSSYSILATGHQLGAFLAAEACDKSDEKVGCQAVVLSGSPEAEKRKKDDIKAENRRKQYYSDYKYKDPEMQFVKMPKEDFFRLYTAIDLGLVPKKRTKESIGEATLCVFDEMNPPPSCMECAGTVKPYVYDENHFSKLVECRDGTVPTGHYNSQCYDDTNFLNDWIERILPSGKMPKCTEFKGNTLMEKKRKEEARQKAWLERIMEQIRAQRERAERWRKQQAARWAKQQREAKKNRRWWQR